VLFAIALTAFLLLDAPGYKRVPALRSGSDVSAQRALTTYLEAHGGENCAPDTYTVTKTRMGFVPSVRATAAVSCDAVGTGPKRIGGVHFSSLNDLHAWERENHNNLRGDDVAGRCGVVAGQTPWTDLHDVIRGALYCEPQSTGSYVAWSDRPRLSAFYASSEVGTASAIISWWRHYIRGKPPSEASALRTIRTTVARAVRGGATSCNPSLDALADGVLNCDRVTPRKAPRRYVDTLTIFHFRDGRSLDAFFKNTESEFRAPTRPDSDFCDKAALVSSTYVNRGQTAGRIFCYPSDGGEYLVWTVDDRNLALEISRADQDIRSLYRAWQALAG
jgi:hypothetical protein